MRMRGPLSTSPPSSADLDPSAQVAGARLLPLAITTEDEDWGCVAGLDRSGRWLRPSPIPAAWARDPSGPFRYRYWTALYILPHPTSARPEDRAYRNPSAEGPVLDDTTYRSLLTKAADKNVATAFSGARTAGLVRARIEAIYARRHTRGRTFLRLAFQDADRQKFDWIVPEVATTKLFSGKVVDGTLDPTAAADWVAAANAVDVFLAIGLTLPNDRMPGIFRGCHPLVVGIHLLPFAPASCRDQPDSRP